MGDAGASPRKIVIIGGGVAGCSTAYFLSRHALFHPSVHAITLLEATAIADGASGKAGGLLANWATPRCLAPLSFRTHCELSEQHGGSEAWGFRRVHFAEVTLQARNLGGGQGASASAPSGTAAPPGELDWFGPGSIRSYEEIGSPENTAQVDPYRFTHSLARLAMEAGVSVLQGSATSINYREDAAVESVTFSDGGESKTIEATDVVVAAGPWTTRLAPSIKLLAPRGHSVIARPTRELSPYVVYADIKAEAGSGVEPVPPPEIYPRPPEEGRPLGTVYASNPDDYEVPLPPSTARVDVDLDKCADLWKAMSSVSPAIRDGEAFVRQACYKAQIRPHHDHEEVGPILGPGAVEGLWIATGFDEWGIQNSPGAGLVLSEMIWEGRSKSAGCESLNPRHFAQA